MEPKAVRTDEVEKRRRAQAEQVFRLLAANAILGDDDSVSWIAPVLKSTGWSVQPLLADLYSGLSGVALVVAAYCRETKMGRANAVPEIEALQVPLQRSLLRMEERILEVSTSDVRVRPAATGAYLGLASQIYALLIVGRWTGYEGNELTRACALAKKLVATTSEHPTNDVISGRAGAIVNLLRLASATRDVHYIDLACRLGDQLCAAAEWHGDSALWHGNEEGASAYSGFAHGATGIGWALAQLAKTSGRVRYREVADAAFSFEESLYSENDHGPPDLPADATRDTTATWCYGAVGIGLAHLSLDPKCYEARTRQTLLRSVATTIRSGFGRNHCLCHGDAGALELIGKAAALGFQWPGPSQEALVQGFITSLEDFGPACGTAARDAFAPGLLAGVGGVGYALLKAHPESDLPSVLTLEC